MKINKKILLKRVHILILLTIPIFWFILTNAVSGSIGFWLTYWSMAPIAFLTAVVVNMVGISGAALFVLFLNLFSL